MKSILFTVSILVATHAAHSQSRLDSLQALYDSANNDSARISIGLSMLDDMANQQPLMAIELSEQLLKEIPQSDVLSEDHRNDWTMRVLHALSNAYRYVGDNERVVKVLLQELDMAGAIGDASRERGVLMNIGVAYQNVGMKDEALNYYRRSLKISLDENHVYGIAMAYGNIGTLQGNTADQDSQLFYYKLSLGAMKQEGMYHREAAMGWMMNNIGKCHELAGIPDSDLY